MFTSLVAEVVCYRKAKASYLGAICPCERFSQIFRLFDGIFKMHRREPRSDSC